MKLSDIQNRLSGTELKDIIVAGFVENNDRPIRFHALWRTVYFECSGILLRLDAIGDSGRMRLALVDSVFFDAELDDDMLPASSSIRLQVLRDPDGSNALLAIHIWNMVESSDEFQCAAARLDLLNGQRIFIDPSYYFGIRLGGHEQEEVWEANWFESRREEV
ncbi:MAG: hypothetical protein L6Q76_31375, partial [Polyangiaceae bacterium]|nr:hypothetical protein [Polyangiaceae bacterium]